jgi:hypothetical protein
LGEGYLPNWASVVGDNAAEGGPIHKFASDNHSRDSCCIADVGCRIGVQQDYVASLPHLNGALQGFASKKYRRIDGGCLQGFQRREAGLGEPLQLIMEAEARHLPIATRQKMIAARVKIANRAQGDDIRLAESVQCLASR